MRILVTGNQGFIGRVVERRLIEAGCEIVGFDIVDGDDIRNPELVSKKTRGCDTIVHLAAVEGRSDTEVMETNVMGTWNVLNAGSYAKVDKIIFMSSVDVLGIFQGEGTPLYLPIDDDYPSHPVSVYSISKKLAEDMCGYFSGRTGIPVICFRPPGVWDESTYHKISDARKRRPEYEWDPYWEYGAFIDVRDLAEAVLRALQTDIQGFQKLLLAADDITTSGLTSLQLVKKLHPDVPWKGGQEYESAPFSALVKSTRAKALLSWSPHYSWRGFTENQGSM
jgi:nucleoside-diphosphate-sugar epimerase